MRAVIGPRSSVSVGRSCTFSEKTCEPSQAPGKLAVGAVVSGATIAVAALEAGLRWPAASTAKTQ